MDMQLISQEDTFLWQLREDVKGETESEIIAAQDQALQTKYAKKKYYQQQQMANVNNLMGHIVSVCSLLAKEQYIKGHDKVCAQLHFNAWKEMGVKLDNKHYFDHVTNSVETSHAGRVTILWNHQVRTVRTIPNNKLDFIIHVIKREHAC
jgi:hypothetical protein